jgi:hypothetical protein
MRTSIIVPVLSASPPPRRPAGKIIRHLEGACQAAPPKAKLKQERQRQWEAVAAATERAARALGSEALRCHLADPPWDWKPFSRETGMDRAAANHYPTMSLDEIKAVKVPAAKDCDLFLWAIPSMLPQALTVIEAWGFVFYRLAEAQPGARLLGALRA